jgi:hypothetical protein
LSWFTHEDAVSPLDIYGGDAVRALDNTGDTLPILNTSGPTKAPGADGWDRWDYFFDVVSDGPTEIVVRPTSETPAGQFVNIAGLQLVEADPIFDGNLNANYADTMTSRAEYFPPGAYYPTDDDRIDNRGTCRDDGTELRRRAFTYGCTNVCPEGYDRTCDPDVAERRCYWQTAVDMSSSALARNVAGTPAGFAAGNYNYRIEGVSVNLVGTGLRNCARDGSSGCYGSGNLSFSILHQGPFPVLNAQGGLYLAPIFPGRIEGARALAAERYISNPVSGADEALLAPFMRRELSGRPLSGTFLIRIWDEPTFDFRRLEDVQLILNYRYWTHQR